MSIKIREYTIDIGLHVELVLPRHHGVTRTGWRTYADRFDKMPRWTCHDCRWRDQRDSGAE